MTTTARRRRYLWLLLRVLFVTVILGFIISRLDLSSLLVQARLLDWRYFVVGFALWMVALVVASYRWKILLDVVAPGTRVLSLLIFNFVGVFYNQFLPGSVTGDLVKGVYLARTQADKVGIMSSVLADRFIGILVNGLLGLVALATNAVILHVLGLDTNILLIVLVAIVVALLAGYLALRLLDHWQSRLPALIVSISRTIKCYLQAPGALLKASIASLVFFLIWSLALWCLAFAANLNIDFPTILLILAAVNLAQFIPLSINGWGVREGALIVLLSAYNVPPEKSVLLSLLTAAVSLIIAILGGIIVLTDYQTTQSPPVADERPLS